MYSCVKLRNLFLVSLVCLLALTSLAQSQTRYSGGAGTAQSPYEIATAQDLIDLGNNTDDYDKHFIMTADIDLAGRVFDRAVIAPDTTQGNSYDGITFSGKLNGNGHIISSLSITNPSANYLGLFGYISQGAIVEKLGIINGTLVGNYYVGGIAARSAGTVKDCFVAADIICTHCGGGIVGLQGNEPYSGGAITNCYTNGSVYGETIGGIAGFNGNGVIVGCFTTSELSGSRIGGIFFSYDSCVGGFYDYESCGIVPKAGDRCAKSTSEMTTYVTYSDAQWDFSGVDGDKADWKMFPGQYPLLAWEISDKAVVPVITGLTEADAKSELEYLEYNYRCTYEYDCSVESGKVIYQNPPSGTVYDVGCEVEMVVSLGQFLSGGSGTLGDPYQISSVDDLILLGNTPSHQDDNFILINNIDCSGIVFTKSVIAEISGSFDGNCHLISNLCINSSKWAGLFEIVRSTGVVKNLGLEAVSIYGSISAGGLASTNYGTISGSYVTGYIDSYYSAGGLVSSNIQGNITNCYSSCLITSGGGLIGSSDHGSISNCYSTSIFSGTSSVAGLIGHRLDGDITACYWDKQISCTEQGVGTYSSSSDGITGMNTAGMQQQINFASAGWDFSDADGDAADWQMISGWYPALAWETVALTTVPDVVDLTPEQVKVELQAIGLKLGALSYRYDEVATGHVCEQLPVAGILWRVGCSINMTVSLGHKYSGGNGTATDPFIISTADDLISLGNNTEDYDKVFVLANEVDMSGHDFTQAVIAADTDIAEDFQGTKFTGSIDGNGYSIDNLKISGSGTYVGLIGCIDTAGKVSNLKVRGADIAGMSNVGAIAGISYGSITGCNAAGQVLAAADNAGGICGSNSGTISESYADCVVAGTIRVGGLCGAVSGTAIKSYALGTVSGESRVGGLAGSCYNGTINQCYAAGLLVSGQLEVGGLCGYNNTGTITECYAAVPTVAVEASVGGLCGYSSGTVSRSVWDTEVSGQNATIGNGVGLPTLAMQQVDCYVIDKWFGHVWTLPLGSYPRLAWEQAGGDYITSKTLIGSGTEIDPWQIASLADLVSVGLNSNNYGNYFILTADIDCSGYVFMEALIAPYRSINIALKDKQFTGSFNGNGHTISNLTINNTTERYSGLFGYCQGSKISGINLVNVNIAGSGYVGGLVGYCTGTVANCSVSGVVTGQWCVGGLVGELRYSGKLSDCGSSADVSGNAYDIGGICGSNASGSITGCFATGNIVGGLNVGGICGYNGQYYYIDSCYFTGNVSVDMQNIWWPSGITAIDMGGICGANVGKISRCFSTGHLTLPQIPFNWQLKAGAITGESASASSGLVNIENCVWDIQATGLRVGCDNVAIAGGVTYDYKTNNLIGLPTQTMQSPLVFSALGWSGDTWTIVEGEYPRLAWEQAEGEPIPALTIPFAGSGTVADPYKITSGPELITAGKIFELRDKAFVLENNIDLADYVFDGPLLGNYKHISGQIYPYYGNFDGADHTISNLTIKAIYQEYVGLFGQIGRGTIKELHLENVDITGDKYVGGLCGQCVASDETTIERCSVSGRVSALNTSAAYAGGLLGFVSNGYEFATRDCYSSAQVSGRIAGGLFGVTRGTIAGSYATGSVKATDTAGGFCGYNNAVVSDCYATGSSEITATPASAYTHAIGGFSAINGATIDKCYSTGAVTYPTATPPSHKAAFCGYNSSVIQNSIWNTDKTGVLVGYNGTGTVTNLLGKTTAQMKDINTFTGAGWDFTEADGSPAIWQMIGSNYPTLAWQLTTDLDGSGSVDLADFAIMAANWLMPVSGLGMPDYDRSGIIDMPDFEVFLADWLYQEPSSLIGHWTLDETGGTIAADVSEYNNPGTVTGSPAYSTGVKDGCYAFDGDDYIVSEGCRGVAGTLPRTVAAWIKADADLANDDKNLRCVVSWGSSVGGSNAKWFISIDDATGKLALGIYGARLIATGANTLEDGQWHHIAVVMPVGATNINQVKMFIDGAEVTTNAGSLNAVMNTALSEVSIGANNTSTAPGTYTPAQLFKGSIDDVRIYNKALTAAEIAQMAQITIE